MEELPNDCIKEIMNNLPYKDLVIIRFVFKRFYDLVYECDKYNRLDDDSKSIFECPKKWTRFYDGKFEAKSIKQWLPLLEIYGYFSNHPSRYYWIREPEIIYFLDRIPFDFIGIRFYYSDNHRDILITISNTDVKLESLHLVEKSSGLEPIFTYSYYGKNSLFSHYEIGYMWNENDLSDQLKKVHERINEDRRTMG